jgi:pimeloyl-ACP methyl ester carboxylesterase
MSHKTVEANGLRFAYLEEGAGQLVLLVHGFPDTPQSWEHVRPALAKAGYRAVTPWTRAYLPTEIPKDGKYDAETLGKDVIALVDALGGGPAILVGHDFGAAAAFAAVTMAPDRFKQMITVGIPHPKSIRPTPMLAWKVRHFFTLSRKNAAAKIRKGDFKHIDELVQRWSPVWKVPPGETDAVKRSFREEGCLEAVLGYYRAISRKIPESQRGKIKVPSIAFAGEHDTISTKMYERARRCYEGSYEVVTMPGGHFMHREHPAHFERELLRVIAR